MSNSCTRSRNIGCAYGSQECQKGLWCCMNLLWSSLLAPRGTAVNTSLSPKMSSSTLQVSQTLELHNSTSESFHFSQVVIFTGDAWAEGIGNNSEASRRFAEHFFFGPFFLLKFQGLVIISKEALKNLSSSPLFSCSGDHHFHLDLSSWSSSQSPSPPGWLWLGCSWSGGMLCRPSYPIRFYPFLTYAALLYTVLPYRLAFPF